MTLGAEFYERQCILDNVIMVFTFVLDHKMLSVLKYFVKKCLTSIANCLMLPHSQGGLHFVL